MVRKNLESNVGIWNPVLDHPVIQGPINTYPLEYNDKTDYREFSTEKPDDSKIKKLNSRLKDRDYK